MNKTLIALMNKLSWQVNEVSQVLQTINDEQGSLQKTHAELQEQLQKACATTVIINPEQEIARLHFIMHKQQEQDHLTLRMKELEAQQAQLKKRKIRLDIELKMLDRYQEKQQEKALENEILLQQNANDEWILQRKKPV
jgi:chromosome segregation ATPase